MRVMMLGQERKTAKTEPRFDSSILFHGGRILMKEFKRFLASALASLMIFSSLALSTSAKSFEDVASDYKFAEQINILSDIGITKGTSDTEYSPDENVTREQMAILLYRLMVGNDNSGKLNSTPFVDLTDDTYMGAISWAYANGYILGTSENTFEPREGITLQDAMTMLVRILGHETSNMAKGYPWTYINSAVKLNLDIDLDGVGYEKNLTRGEVAAILYNTLTAEYLIPKTVVNGVTLYESTTIIEKIFGYKLAEATIVATNNYATDNASTVVKDGYVSLAYTEDNASRMITVKYSDLGLDGSADSNLGRRVKVVYSIDSAKNVKVLGATEIGKVETMNDGITVHEDKTTGKYDYVEIGETRYNVVETLSDKLSTNENELLVYAYGNNSKLTQITSNEALNDILGIYNADLIFDNRSDDTASRLIIKPYGFDKLEVSSRGEYNIADDLKESELKGGLSNTAKADDGDYVLYYYNKANKSLEIVSVIPVSSAQTVSRLTDTTVKIGDKTYKLGCEALGITAASLKRELSVGDKVRAVAVNGMLLAIEDGIEDGAASNYLIALSNSRPVFTNGEFGYAVKVNLDGEVMSVFTETDNVSAGKAYRYTVSKDGKYTLIPYIANSGVITSGSDQFVQNSGNNSDIAFIVEDSDGATITKNSADYTLSAGESGYLTSEKSLNSEVKFVTDNSTVIVVGTTDSNGDSTYTVRKGVFDGNISIEDGAYVAAIFKNETGSTETLRYLYISNGSFSGATSSANAVKVLEVLGKEYIDGKVYTIYNTLNLDTGVVDTLYSTSGDLEIGANYKLNNDGNISGVEAEIANGIITGYTSATVTIGSDTYKISKNLKVFEIDEDFDVTSHKLSSAYLSYVEYVIDDGEVTSILVHGDAPMTAEYKESKITVTCGFDFSGINTFSLKNVKLDGKSIDISGFTTERNGNTVTVTADSELEAGSYTINFSMNGKTIGCDFEVK